LQVSDYDVSFTGFDAKEIDTLFNEMFPKDTVEDDCDIPLPENPISRQGDIWLLGRHRLLCGDSTKAESYEKLMDGKKANLVVTDPPYNINIQGGTKDKLKIQNDNMPDQDFYNFLLDFYKCSFDVMEDGAAIYVFHADTEGINFRTALKNAGFHLSSICIWVKDSLVLGRSDYHFRHEPVIYAFKQTGKHKWYSDRKQNTVWEFPRPKKSELHPTMKPIALIAYPITNSSMTNCIVLDPFGGSGTTLIACEQTSRICNMIEFDPKYVDVILSRFISQVGSSDDVILIRDGIQTKYADLPKEGCD
jgi:DNA modification methylase